MDINIEESFDSNIKRLLRDSSLVEYGEHEIDFEMKSGVGETQNMMIKLTEKNSTFHGRPVEIERMYFKYSVDELHELFKSVGAVIRPRQEIPIDKELTDLMFLKETMEYEFEEGLFSLTDMDGNPPVADYGSGWVVADPGNPLWTGKMPARWRALMINYMPEPETLAYIIEI